MINILESPCDASKLIQVNHNQVTISKQLWTDLFKIQYVFLNTICLKSFLPKEKIKRCKFLIQLDVKDGSLPGKENTEALNVMNCLSASVNPYEVVEDQVCAFKLQRLGHEQVLPILCLLSRAGIATQLVVLLIQSDLENNGTVRDVIP